MNRHVFAIAIAAAATLGATASFAAPAAGEFSGVEQAAVPYTASVAKTPRASYNQVAQGAPAAGEFSAADGQAVAGAPLSREQVRHALNNAQPTVNGEVPEAYAAAPAVRTREEVRQEGRMALRAGQIATGNLAM
ncbi:MAG: hypothetical protein C0445_10970 [Polaromonas sp.]|nr:hypothetical protein [Polaromonas sp.]